ncbi:putative aldehyde dehydrogenase [Seiridium cupressi]
MTQTYDFIVVGAYTTQGGASGCVVAARLAESAAKPTVLLLEAGGMNEDAAHLTGAQRFEVAFREGSLLNWSYKTEPQWSNQQIDYSRGKGLGGSTAINFCGWVVGADEDYNEWSRRVGDEDFSWSHVKKVLKKVENFHNDVPDEYRSYIKPKNEEHGIGGAIDVSYQEEWLPTTRDVFKAAQETGFGINPDVNNGNPIGMGIGTVCIYKGIRVTSSSAYLTDPPSNLKIIIDAHIEKIILDAKVAVGVQTVDGRQFNATKEVIVSAGALNSPQILLLSGIGPADGLQRHGVVKLHELPQVGKNLQDHCFSTAGIVIKKDHDKNFKQSPTPMGWFKVPSVLASEEFGALPREMQEYLQKPHVPSWEMATHTPYFNGIEVQDDEEIFSCICLVMNPQSRGTVTLRSKNPKDAPVIDPKFLTHPFDRRTAVESFRELLKFFQAPVWKKKTVANLGWPRDDTDEAIWETFSSNLKSSWHMCGTVNMGKDATQACVDSSFKVFGIKGLRVADLSVCPLVPNNHTQTTAYVVGYSAAASVGAEKISYQDIAMILIGTFKLKIDVLGLSNPNAKYFIAYIHSTTFSSSLETLYSHTIRPSKFVDSANGNTFDLFSPYSGDLVAKVAEATEEDVNKAVAAAKAAFPAWEALSPAQRGKPMARLAQLIAASDAELAKADALSLGRPVSTYFDGYYAATHFRYFSEAAYPVGTSSLNTPGFMNISLRQPYGVCAAIIPWNSPLVFYSKKLAPALAAGNTIILKTSEKAPLSADKVNQLLNEAGFPPGVINVVHGHGAVSGNAISSHMDIRALSFTGSVRTGRQIQKAAADSNFKHLIFELGGKSPAIVFEDADLERAAQETQHSIMWHSGQTCMANSRIYVQKTIADKFMSTFNSLAAARQMGDPTLKDTQSGPQADKSQFETVRQYIEEGRKTGELVEPGTKIPETNADLFVAPVVFLQQPEDSKIMKEEVFGPVVCINTFETEEEALRIANDTEYGLYAAVYTNDLDRAMRCAKSLESGMVGVNCTSPTGAWDMPFGGYKQSGVGRESFLLSMDDWLEQKAVFIRVGGSGARVAGSSILGR